MLLQLLLYMIGELREKWMPNGWHNQCHNVAAIGFEPTGIFIGLIV